MSEKKMVTFLDSVSRTIIGMLEQETETTLKVENPVIVHVVPQQDPATGQMKMSLQLFPIFFREFLGDKEASIVWEYKKENITLPTEEVVFDFRLHAQYANLFAPVASVPAAPEGNEPIKLFEDK